MPTPLLMTKLNMPQLRPKRVFRSALIDLLNGGLSGKLTLVSAPAGYGKTTMILEWLSQCPGEYRMGWISLDENDNDPVQFLAYIIAAVGQSISGFGETVRSLLQSPQPPPGEVILTALLNEIAGIPSPFILILDDYHTIHTPAIHKLMANWLEHQPTTIHLVLISREDPLLPIARLRARGYLTEIRQDDLRFSHHECLELLQNMMGIAISDQEVAALERRTEGWITGLQLAAISLQNHKDSGRFIREFTGSSRYILDYLIDEVFAHQSESTQKFLVKTSVLERLSGPLCQAVTGQDDSLERLEALEQVNLFIIPLDQTRTWYRYHRLFSELLRNRLRRTEMYSLAELHNRASQWFLQNDFVSEGIQHAIAAQNWERVMQILTQVNDEMLKRGETTTLVRWYGSIPREVLIKDPQSCLDYSWPLILTGHYQEATELLDHLEKISQENPTFLGEIMTAQAFIARATGQHAHMVNRSERARRLLPKESVVSRGIVAINLGLAYWHRGKMQATEEVLVEAIQASQASGNQYALITAIILQGRVLAVKGKLKAAAEKYQQAIESGRGIPINALAHLDMSALYFEWNQLEEAEPHLQKAFDLSRRGQNEEFEVACWMMESNIQLAKGNGQAAQNALNLAQALTDTGKIPSLTVSRFEMAKLRFALAQDDLVTTHPLYDNLAEDIDSHNFCRFTNLIKAKLMLTQNQHKKARFYLADLASTAQGEGWQYALISIRAHQALVAETEQKAVNYLEEALNLAQPEGFLRIFVDTGVGLTPILHQAARFGIKPVYIGRILSALQSNQGVERSIKRLAEPLSERELEVLHLIVAGLSNREIAQNLVISLGTAKTHVHNIYSKLNVRNRAHAIARAREIDLV
jgi:LuxR family maltose regulon positive regulatory protein